MKTKLFLTTLLIAVSIAGQAKSLTPREQLLNRLQKIQKKGYMYGHQDARSMA